MIDLLSTNDGIEEQTQRELHLLAAVIAKAIEDICQVPSSEELKHRCNLNAHAVSALAFFYGDNSMFTTYSGLIGIDPDVFIEAMERREYEHHTHKKGNVPWFSHRDVKAMRLRISWWINSPVQSRQLEFDF